MPIITEELDGFPKETQELGVFTATRKLKCAWADRFTLVNEKLGQSGEVYPYRVTYNARARRATIEPFGGVQGSGEVAVYTDAIVTVVYTTPRPGFGDRTDSFGNVISESFEPWVENRILDSKDFRWINPIEPLQEQEAPSQALVGFDYVFTRHRLGGIPFGPIAKIGMVNDSVIVGTFSGVIFPAETLLMLAPTITHTVEAAISTSKWDVVYRFSFRPSPGWNQFWRKKAQAYQRIHHREVPPGQSTQYDQYPLTDFTTI